MLLPVVAFLGAPGSGRKSLVRSLLGHQQAPPSEQQQPHDDPVWRIHTKYYSANVALRCVQTPVSQSEAQRNQPPFEAVVLVFDATDPASFGAVRAWADSNAANTEAAGVRLAVATHADRLAAAPSGAETQISSASPPSTTQPPDSSCLQRPKWLSDAMDWCAGECYEYVECSTTDGVLDSQLRLEGDVQGITRITQALQAHVWPGLVMVEQGGGRGPAHSQPRLDSASTSGQDTDSAAQQQSLEGGSGKPEPLVPGKPDAPSGQGVSNSTSKDEQQEQQRQQPERSQQQRSRQSALQSKADNADDSDALERLMEQMAAAKHQCHQLPDDQRRAQAAALAMKFASMLGSDSEGEGGYDTD